MTNLFFSPTPQQLLQVNICCCQNRDIIILQGENSFTGRKLVPWNRRKHHLLWLWLEMVTYSRSDFCHLSVNSGRLWGPSDHTSGVHTSWEHSFWPVWVNEGLPPCTLHRKKSDFDCSSLIKKVRPGTLITFLTSHSGKKQNQILLQLKSLFNDLRKFPNIWTLYLAIAIYFSCSKPH